MRIEILKQVNMFEIYNDITLKGEIVVYGSTYMTDFPFYELSQKYMLSDAIYNRSIKGLTLAEAEEALNICVLQANPSIVFLSLGECDIDNPSAIEIYNRIIKKIKLKLPQAKLYVMSVYSKNKKTYLFNEQLNNLCKTMNIVFLNLLETEEKEYSKIFKRLTCFFRQKPISFSEAFVISR